MSVPSVQIKTNDNKVEVFWDLDVSGVYVRFKLYYGTDSGMAGETAFSDTFLNSSNTRYSNKHIFYTFDRSKVGVSRDSGFYLRVKGIKQDSSEVPGDTRYIPAAIITDSDEYQYKLHGYNPIDKSWSSNFLEDRNYGTISTSVMMQPSAHNTGVNASAQKDVNGIWSVVDLGSNRRVAKGLTSSIDGTLYVHLVDDLEGSYCPISLKADEKTGFIFDKVDVDSSTAGLFSAGVLYFWL